MGHRGRLGGKGAWQSEGERSDSEADGAEEAEGGAALSGDELERLVWETAAVADPDECARVGALAHEREPDKYPYTHLTELSSSNYVAGNPLYDILHDGRTVFDGPPLMSLLTSWSIVVTAGTAVTEWNVDMPRA